MAILRRKSAKVDRWRIGTTVVLAALAAACSADNSEPIDLGTSIAAAPPSTTTEVAGAALLRQPAAEPRAITSGDGSFPAYLPLVQTPDLLAVVGIGGDRIWVPWPPYQVPDPLGQPAVEGSQSALVDDMERGYRHIVDQRSQWEAMPPYIESAREAIADGTRVARRRAGTSTAWELVIDPSRLDHETRVTADRTGAYDHVSLCPAHPTAEVLGIDLGSTAEDRDRAGAVVEAFITGMRSPGGRPMHSWGTTVNDVAKLLTYSPGEPMELALGGHSLTDLGFFPGDWSVQARQWLSRRAAQGAVTDSLVGHAVVSSGPETLWEACSDLASITSGIYTESHRTRQLESLWARGLRLMFTTPPVARAWVADLSAAGHALAVVCHEPGQSHLVDASTGELLDAGIDQPAHVEAMWLTWSRLSYRVQRNGLFEGNCEGEAFGEAIEWLQEAKDAHAAGIDWSEPRAWASGVRNEWIAVRDWIEIPQSEAWHAHRDQAWHLELWCRTGIPVGTLVDGELQRPSLKNSCTPSEWDALSASAAAAPEVSSELSATKWQSGASWHERMYLSPFKSLEEMLGCSPDPETIAEALNRPVERRTKRPWPPGSLPLTPAGQAYPRPMPPCPQAGWPPQTDQFWWPATQPPTRAIS